MQSENNLQQCEKSWIIERKICKNITNHDKKKNKISIQISATLQIIQ